MSRGRVWEDWLDSLDSDSFQSPNYVDDPAFNRALQSQGAAALPGAGGSTVLLSSTTLAAPAPFNITGIPASYNDLIIIGIVRSTDGAASGLDGATLNFNGDSGPNYWREVGRSTDNTGDNSANPAATGATVGNMPSSLAAANSFGVLEVTVFGYASPLWHKSFIHRFWARSLTSGGPLLYAGYGGGLWANTGAVNRVQITGTGNWVTGSQLRIYGRL